MKKAKLFALGLAAVVALSGCAATDAAAEAEAPLAVTGEVSYPLQTAQREALIEKYLAGENVATELAAFCRELAIVDGVTGTYAEQWIIGCETPDYVWDAYTDTWVPAEDAVVNN